MSHIIREYRETDKAPITSIIKTVWGDQAVEKFNVLHPWFRSRSIEFASEKGDLVLESKGRVAGYVRVVPCEYQLAGERINAGYFADFVVNPENRGAGVKLARYLAAVPDVLWVGAPVVRFGDLWPKIVKREVKVKSIERAVLVFSPSVFMKSKGIPSPLGLLADWLWQYKMHRKLKIFKQASSGFIQLSEQSVLPSATEIDTLFTAFSKDFYAIAVRDLAFLKWRFRESSNDYRYIWARSEGRLIGYMIYREGTVGGRKTLLIVETMAVGDAANCYRAMLGLVCQYGLESGFSDLQTLTSGCSNFLKVLQQLGAVLKEEEVSLIACLRSDELYATEMCNEKKWFISMAEADHEFVMFK
jgi:hypothetical protein